ncbi:hypothetical protein [Thalassobacillus pellis]|uniref:hypothetical protein n=1 Tax=Thalassobacillus pellis TaxID=748008 RepID=UPI00195FECE5|nr:hypothetical protein [Thalassobacillus pellis]MBM7552898.1 hypothetical protein [Thalassobacillus pellis]
MIVQIKGNVKYPITLDPTVWIFDDRKISFEEAFGNADEKDSSENDLEKASMRWDREIYQQKINPPVNKSISRFEKEKILKGTYLIPLKPFVATSEPDRNSDSITLVTNEGDVEITISQMQQSLALFSEAGKPLKENGPIHIYFEDESNKDKPIKGVQQIIFH